MYETQAMVQLHQRHPNVDFYIKHLPDHRRVALETLREKIHDWIPVARENMQYRIPTFVTTAVLCALGVQRRHIGLYVCVTDILDENRDKLSHLKVGRSCIRFNDIDELPLPVIKEILLQSQALIEKIVPFPLS